MKNSYTSTKNKLKANPENKTIEQSYQGLRTEGVRCWAKGQEEKEKGKQKGKRKGVGLPGLLPGPSLPKSLHLSSLATPLAAGGSPLY